MQVLKNIVLFLQHTLHLDSCIYLHIHTIFYPCYAGLFHTVDHFPCNCTFYLCYQLEMLTLQGKSEFGEEKRVGGSEVRWVRWVKKLSNLPVIQTLLRSCSVMWWCSCATRT